MRRFQITGMSCAACSARVEKAVRAVPGVQRCEVNLLTNSMQLEGSVESAEIVRAVRKKYDGENRNPFSEMECGSSYARSMASYALLPIFSGFLFDLPHGRIGFNPIEGAKGFRCPFSLGGAFGTVETEEDKATLKLLSGHLSLTELSLPFLPSAKDVVCDGKPISFTFADDTVIFTETAEISSEITVYA